MKKAFVTLLSLLLFSAFQAAAFNLKLKKTPKPRIDYTAWVASKDLPATVGETMMFYPQTVTEDSVTVVTGSISVPGLTARQAMLAAMVFAIENFSEDPDSKDCFTAVDYLANEFTINIASTQGSNDKETTYTRDISFKAADGKIDFTVSGIKVKYRQKGIIPRTVEMETLHPDTEGRHEELVMEFSEINSDYLSRLGNYARTRNDISATHYDEMKEGSVVNGMNMDEVKISMGQPLDTRKSGDRIRWIYGNDNVIIFTDGVVTRVVE